jgi:hypothetical protein
MLRVLPDNCYKTPAEAAQENRNRKCLQHPRCGQSSSDRADNPILTDLPYRGARLGWNARTWKKQS